MHSRALPTPQHTPPPTHSLSLSQSLNSNGLNGTVLATGSGSGPLNVNGTANARPLTPAPESHVPATNGRRFGYSLEDFQLLQTLGTGTFGRVYLSKLNPTPSDLAAKGQYFAMKVLKKVEVVRLKQVEHINSEKHILSQIRHPFIVNLYVFPGDRTPFAYHCLSSTF